MDKTKQIILTKEQYCFLNNIDRPEDYESVEEVSKWLILQDELNIKKVEWETK